MSRLYGRLQLSNDRTIWRMTGLEPHVVIKLKQIFARIPKTSGEPYDLGADGATCADIMWFLQRYPMEMADRHRGILRRRAKEHDRSQDELSRILAPGYQTIQLGRLQPGQVVRPYQALVGEVLARSKGLLLGDDVGLGKTYATAAAFVMPGMLPAAVVCQAHLQKQWTRVIEAFTTLKVHPVKVTKPYPIPAGTNVVVFRYTNLAGWVDVLERLGLKTVAFDEIQELRHGDETHKGQAAKRLCSATEYRLGLSATPIYNFMDEMFSVMDLLRPGILGTWGEFMTEWNTQEPKALGSYLREQHAFIRRTKADVGQQMPAVNRIIDEVDYDHESVASIEETARKLALRATSGRFEDRGQAARELDLLVRKQTGVAKAPFVADFVRILVEAGEPVVLAGWHRACYEIWNERLADLKPVMYTGTESATQKNAAAEAFIKGETDLFIISLRSGAGLDGLQRRGSTVVFGELDWSPGVHEQVIGRLNREGQTKPVTAIFLVTDDGSDPPMMEMLGLKASEASQLRDPSLGVQAVHSDRSRVQMLVERYLGRRASTKSETQHG